MSPLEHRSRRSAASPRSGARPDARQAFGIRTEEQYVSWARRYILFHGKRHPREMDAPELEAFLSHRAVARNVSASTQKQAKAALLFLCAEVLGTEIGSLKDVPAAKLSRRLPVVLTKEEVRAVLGELQGVGPAEATLGAGDADISMLFGPPMVLRVDADEPVVFLAGVHVGCIEVFAQKGIRTIGDLKRSKGVWRDRHGGAWWSRFNFRPPFPIPF